MDSFRPTSVFLVASTLLFIAGAEPKYMGCYRDISLTTRLMNGLKSDYPGKLTIKICSDNCKTNGFRYAGMEYKKECFCSNERPSFKYLADEVDCNQRCDGDENETCGGNYRLSVYDLDGSDIKNEVSMLYMGCFEDSESNRLLPNARRDTDLLTPEYCVGYCYARGYRYAGAQYGKECYCGEKLNEARRADNGDCSIDCKGESSFKCGGNWRLSVYKTGITDRPLDENNYLGCFRDNNPEFRVLSAVKYEMSYTNTPERCMNLCYSEGFKYSGTEYRFECYCGNRRPAADKEWGEDKCRMSCTGDSSQFCGGEWALLVYATGKGIDTVISKPQLTNLPLRPQSPPLGPSSPGRPDCRLSRTTVNGKPACSETVIFSEDFSSGRIDPTKWSHSILMPSYPDYDFVVFTNSPDNSYVEDGKLIIEPTLQNDDLVTKGKLVLNNCTGKQFSDECEREAKSLYILPPVASAKIHTKNSFSFRYGTVDIVAKLPLGDWLVPVLTLEPTWKAYGPGLASGRVLLASALGNARLDSEGKDIGNRHLKSGFSVGLGENVKCSVAKRVREEGWAAKSHNFTFIWKPNSLSFLVDGEVERVVYPAEGAGSQRLTAGLGFTSSEQATWSSGTALAPFDQEFFLNIGVSAGGMTSFPIGSNSGGKPIPWENWNIRAQYNFWKAKKDWFPTWSESNTLQIESVTVTSL